MPWWCGASGPEAEGVASPRDAARRRSMMKVTNWFHRIALACLLAAGLAGLVGPVERAAAAQDWKAVEQALGKAGQTMAGGVYRVGFPRTDLSVTVEGVRVEPAFALGSYAAFKAMG